MRDYVEKNERLSEINQDYQITDKLDEEAAKLPSKIGGAARASCATSASGS